MALAVLRAIGTATAAHERPHREILEHRIPGGAEAYSRMLGELTRTAYVVGPADERLAVARDMSDNKSQQLSHALRVRTGHTELGRTDGRGKSGKREESN